MIDSGIKEIYHKGVKPRKYVDYPTWAESNFYLAPEFTNEPGLIKLSKTPMAIEPLRALSPQSKVQYVVVKKPTQLAGTTIALIFEMASAVNHPGPLLHIGPNDVKILEVVEGRIKPLINSMPILQGIFPDLNRKIKGVKLRNIPIPGGSMTFAGGQSGNPFRSTPYRFVIVDDLSSLPRNIDGQGSVDQIALRRMVTFGIRAKAFFNSTPLEAGVCSLEPIWERTSQGRFCVPCLKCGFMQYLRWGGKDKKYGLKFTRDKAGEVKEVWYQCEGCGRKIQEREKPLMLKRWKYIHKHPGREWKGYQWNAFYSPLGWGNSWKSIVEDFLYATKAMKHGNLAPMQAVVNTLFAETWKEPGTEIDWEKLQKRAISIKDDRISSKIRVITCGVDTQDNRIAVQVVGWGDLSESWVLLYDEYYGKPTLPKVWEKLDSLLEQTWHTKDGRELFIIQCGVDSGDGDHTNAVYSYARERPSHVMAIKGSKTPTASALLPATPQDLTFDGQKIPGGVLLWGIGKHTTTSELTNRLQIKEKSGPGVIHFSKSLGQEYFQQMGNERLVTRVDKDGNSKKVWVREGRIEVRDTFRYAFAVLHALGDTSLTDTLPPREAEEEQVRPPPAQPPADPLVEEFEREFNNFNFDEF